MSVSVLLLQNNPDDATQLREALESADGAQQVRVESADALASGLERLATHEFDVVLLDPTLPDGQGMNAVFRVREGFPDIPVVVVSGASDEALITSALESGVEDYFIKGNVDGSDLNKVIWYAIARKRAQEERRSVEERTFQARKLESLTALAGGMAHDFSRLVAGILGAANLIARDLPETSASGRRAREIQTAALKASDLTRQLISYTGKAPGKRETTNLNELLTGAFEMLRPFLPRHVTLQFELEKPSPVAAIDVTQLRQVIASLAMNGYEALDGKEGTLTVRSGWEEPDAAYLDTCAPSALQDGRPCIYFEIEDSGAGMSESTRRRMFDPFFTTKENHRGLGLSGALGIIQYHGGTMHVDSVEGLGSTVRVLLPAEGVRRDLVARSAAVSTRGTVLIVDDNHFVRQVTSSILEQSGFRVITAPDGAEGLELFMQHAVDAVVLDVVMPEMGGQDVLSNLRAIAPRLPVILVTGYNNESLMAVASRDPATQVLRKPFHASAILDAIKRVLRD